jgi:hypothetical protein
MCFFVLTSSSPSKVKLELEDAAAALQQMAALWYTASVERLEEEKNLVHLCAFVGGKAVAFHQIDAESDRMCMLGTHQVFVHAKF